VTRWSAARHDANCGRHVRRSHAAGGARDRVRVSDLWLPHPRWALTLRAARHDIAAHGLVLREVRRARNVWPVLRAAQARTQAASAAVPTRVQRPRLPPGTAGDAQSGWRCVRALRQVRAIAGRSHRAAARRRREHATEPPGSMPWMPRG
jgi:hypothetical protein